MGKRKERVSIVFRNDQMLCARDELSDAELGRLYEALRSYSIEGRLPSFEGEGPAWRVLFGVMRAAQDDAIRKYHEKCERNRQIAMLRVHQLVPNAANIVEENKIEENRVEENRMDASALMDQKGETGDACVRWL